LTASISSFGLHRQAFPTYCIPREAMRPRFRWTRTANVGTLTSAQKSLSDLLLPSSSDPVINYYKWSIFVHNTHSVTLKSYPVIERILAFGATRVSLNHRRSLSVRLLIWQLCQRCCRMSKVLFQQRHRLSLMQEWNVVSHGLHIWVTSSVPVLLLLRDICESRASPCVAPRRAPRHLNFRFLSLPVWHLSRSESDL
jgi:hypothetical protein